MIRPECAGYYEDGDRQCDGHSDLAEPACKYRRRCQLLIRLGGGPGAMGEANPGNNAQVLELFSDDDLKEVEEKEALRLARPKHVPHHKPPRRVRQAQRRLRKEADAYELAKREDRGDPSPVPRDAVKLNGRPPHDVSVLRVGRPTPVKFQVPRPQALFGFTLPILDALADRFARGLEARRVPETDAHAQVGDVYVHYTRTARGQRTILFRCVKEHKTKNHRICSVWLSRAQPWVNLTLRVKGECLGEVLKLRPPRGLRVAVRDRPLYSEEIEAEGVTPDLVAETAAWLQRVYLAGLIPMRRVKVGK